MSAAVHESSIGHVYAEERHAVEGALRWASSCVIYTLLNMDYTYFRTHVKMYVHT